MPVADCEQDDFLTFKWVGKAREAANGVMCYRYKTSAISLRPPTV